MFSSDVFHGNHSPQGPATDPHVVPWAPSEVKEKDSLQLRLSEATAQLSQSRSGHTLMEAAAADAKARRCLYVGLTSSGNRWGMLGI